MARSVAESFELTAPDGARVACTSLRPPGPASPPLVPFLYGGGGSANTLLEMRPLLERWWASGEVPPLHLVSAELGPLGFYLDDPVTNTHAETIVAEHLLAAARERFGLGPAPAGLLGISMGGYGALKIALARPRAFAAVAAVQPMLEPARYAHQAPPRNRFYFAPGMPPRLLGDQRDPGLYAADHPVGRAIAHAAELREHGPAIYLEAGDCDALNAHDGAELLHRVLWELDIGHEYRLVHGGDHGGPTLAPRLREAMAWLGRRLHPPVDPGLSPDERAWVAFIEGGMQGEPPPAISAQSPVFLRRLRAMLEPARRAAAQRDPTVARRYGRLPPLAELELDDGDDEPPP